MGRRPQCRLSGYWSKALYSKGDGSFERKFKGEWGVAHQLLLASEN